MPLSALQAEIDPNANYNTADAARLLGIHRSTLHRWRAKGHIRCRYRRCNGLPFYRGSDLIKLYNAFL